MASNALKVACMLVIAVLATAVGCEAAQAGRHEMNIWAY
jgi:hypothetical protein